MAEFWAIKKKNIFAPADDASTAIYDKLPEGKLLRIDAVQPRNPIFHRLVFALFAVLGKAYDVPTDAIRSRLLKAIGESYTVTFPDGSVEEVANSIAYSAMDDLQFKALFERLVQAVYTIYGILPADIKREIDNLLAPDRRR